MNPTLNNYFAYVSHTFSQSCLWGVQRAAALGAASLATALVSNDILAWASSVVCAVWLAWSLVALAVARLLVLRAGGPDDRELRRNRIRLQGAGLRMARTWAHRRNRIA